MNVAPALLQELQKEEQAKNSERGNAQEAMLELKEAKRKIEGKLRSAGYRSDGHT